MTAQHRRIIQNVPHSWLFWELFFIIHTQDTRFWKLWKFGTSRDQHLHIRGPVITHSWTSSFRSGTSTFKSGTSTFTSGPILSPTKFCSDFFPELLRFCWKKKDRPNKLCNAISASLTLYSMKTWNFGAPPPPLSQCGPSIPPPPFLNFCLPQVINNEQRYYALDIYIKVYALNSHI
jgi:hypothetical protein